MPKPKALVAAVPMLAELEAKAGLDQQDTARLLGVTASSYSQWRTGVKPLPSYIEASVRAHLALSAAALAKRWAEQRRALT